MSADKPANSILATFCAPARFAVADEHDDGAASSKSIRKTKQLLTHPAQFLVGPAPIRALYAPGQHPWLSPMQRNLQVCDQIYDELHVHLKYFSELFAELQAEVHANVQSWNERRIPWSAAQIHMIEDTQGILARHVREQKLPVIRMQYTTLDACIEACRHQRQLVANATTCEDWPYVNVMTGALPVIYIGELQIRYGCDWDDDSDHEPVGPADVDSDSDNAVTGGAAGGAAGDVAGGETGDSDDAAAEDANLDQRPTVWSAEIKYRFNQKVSMCNGDMLLTGMKETNTGEAMSDENRKWVSEQWTKQRWPGGWPWWMLKYLWSVHPDECWVNDYEVKHLMAYNEESMSLILNLMRLLHDIQLLPNNTCI